MMQFADYQKFLMVYILFLFVNEKKYNYKTKISIR